MLDLYRMLRDGLNEYQDHSQWESIKSTMFKKTLINVVIIIVVLGISAFWHYCIRPLNVSAFGILLVGVGASRLALISARVRVRDFYDATHSVEAVKDRQITEFLPRISGRVVDALFGFGLVAIGFIIRVGVEFV